MISDESLFESDAKAFTEVLHRSVTEATQLGVVSLKEGISNGPTHHKVIDIPDDLALAGIFMQGCIIATKPRHRIDNKFAWTARKEIKGVEIQPPIYGLNMTPILDLNQIKGLLPHHYPFLPVDKVIHLDKSHIIGVKNVSFNETFLPGYFSAELVMPDMFIVEAVA